MVKVADWQTEKRGAFATFITLGSKLYILPLSVNYEKSKIGFSVFSFKAFLSCFIYSLPFIMVLSLFSMQQQYFSGNILKVPFDFEFCPQKESIA